MSRIILDPKKRAQKYHNILLFCTTLKSLKIFYDIQVCAKLIFKTFLLFDIHDAMVRVETQTKLN